MNCQTFEQYLVDYLEGTLSDKDTQDVDAHLEQCVACRTLLTQERAISETLQRLPRLKCPEKVVETVFAEIERAQPHVSWQERLRWWFTPPQLWKIGATAAAMIVLVVMALLYQGGDLLPVQPTYSEAEVAQAKQEIALTLAYVYYVNEKTEHIIEHQLAATQVAIKRPVQAALAQQIESAQTAIRQPVATGFKDVFLSIIN